MTRICRLSMDLLSIVISHETGRTPRKRLPIKRLLTRTPLYRIVPQLSLLPKPIPRTPKGSSADPIESTMMCLKRKIVVSHQTSALKKLPSRSRERYMWGCARTPAYTAPLLAVVLFQWSHHTRNPTFTGGTICSSGEMLDCKSIVRSRDQHN
jgi:hypothetical protein